MKPKEYLLQAQKARNRYYRALEDIERIRTLAEGVKAIRYDKDNVQSSPDPDRFAEYMARLDAAKARLMKAADEYLTWYTTIREQIDSIEPEIYSYILNLRYIQMMPLWKIADETGYTIRHVTRLHGYALAAFGRKYVL